MKTRTPWGAAALTVAALIFAIPSAHAVTVVNVDFQGSGATTHTSTGVAPDPGTTWNPVSVGTTGLALLNSTGTASGITLTLVGAHGHWGVASAADNVTKDYIFGFTGGVNTATVNMSGLPANTPIDLYLYARGDNADQNPLITLASANGGASGTANSAGGAVPFSMANNLVFLEGDSDSSGNVSFTFTNIDGGNDFWAANGFQMVIIPEPSSALLGGLGMLALLRRRR